MLIVQIVVYRGKLQNLTRLSHVRFYILPEVSLHIGKYIVQ